MGREVPKPRGAKISTTIRDDGDGMPWRGQKAMRKYLLWTIFLGTNISPPKGTFEDDFEFSKGGICLFPGGYLFLFFCWDLEHLKISSLTWAKPWHQSFL